MEGSSSRMMSKNGGDLSDDPLNRLSPRINLSKHQKTVDRSSFKKKKKSPSSGWRLDAAISHRLREKHGPQLSRDIGRQEGRKNNTYPRTRSSNWERSIGSARQRTEGNLRKLPFNINELRPVFIALCRFTLRYTRISSNWYTRAIILNQT